jgi:hypothetical protein
MQQRVTRQHLESKISYLNRITGHTEEIYRLDDTGRIIGGNSGTYCLSGAYSGYALHQMSAGGGTGVRDVFNVGHISARQLAELISAYMLGLSEVVA